MNSTNNSQAHLRDRSPGGSQWMSSYAQHKEREMGIADNQNNYRQNNVRDLSNNFQDLANQDDNKSQNTIPSDNLQHEGGGEENQNEPSRNNF